MVPLFSFNLFFPFLLPFDIKSAEYLTVMPPKPMRRHCIPFCVTLQEQTPPASHILQKVPISPRNRCLQPQFAQKPGLAAERTDPVADVPAFAEGGWGALFR